MRVVVKVGGSLKADMESTCESIAKWAARDNVELILVHGGGPQITSALQRHDILLPFENGVRRTSASAITIISQVVNELNGMLVRELRERGVGVTGYGGGNVILAAQILERTGTVQAVDVSLLAKVLNHHEVPVIPPLGIDEEGRIYNINADVVASAVAAACNCDKLIFCTDVPGIYDDIDNGRVLTNLTLDELLLMHHEEQFSAGMIPKVESILAARRRGVPVVYVIAGHDVEQLEWALSDPATEDSSADRVFGTRVS